MAMMCFFDQSPAVSNMSRNRLVENRDTSMAVLQTRVCCFRPSTSRIPARCATFSTCRCSVPGGGVQLRLYVINLWMDPTGDEKVRVNHSPFDAEL